MGKKKISNEQIVTHLGDDYKKFHGAVVPPIYENSLFIYETFEEFTEAMESEHSNYLYWRGTNPTVEIAEQKIALLEKGEKCKLFSSGMAAISAAILSFVKTGEHVLSISNIYGPTTKLFKYLEKFGITHTNINSKKIDVIEAHIKPNTRLIYLESPTTMNFQIVNLPEITELAKQKGLHTIIDNSWATPIFQNPIEFGVDVVVHSASKYLGGHSDLVGGALITSESLMERIFYNEYQLLGGVMPPYEAWLLMRGLRTLPIRMKAHQESASKVAAFLETHQTVKKVNYPGLTSAPDFELGKRMLKGYSGLLSFEIVSKEFESIREVINALEQFNIGVSWGGFESLVLSPNNGQNYEQLIENNIDPGLIRISVGLESEEELIKDLDQALLSI
ncbi:trans-sulfuration enzyme family protein [Virgibacillus sp. JSM 102003]|uniref:trans-sulfuration enzyme family protein n=1 Tax=Virgibacillus sp. JSM 102003 TaxID=1562108 RepID=UPI0035BF9B45